MYPDNLKYQKEEAHTGEELLNSSQVSDLERTCMVIKQLVDDKAFSLNEALELYGLSNQEYDNFLSRHMKAELSAALSSVSHAKDKMMISLQIMSFIYEQFIVSVDSDSTAIVAHFAKLSKEIEEGKVAV